MYAVIRTGGKQYRVSEDDVIAVEKLPGEAGAHVALTDVLLLGGEGEPRVGAPCIAGARVEAEVIRQGRAARITVFKKKRRQNYRRKNGHRQHLTWLKITGIHPAETITAESGTAESGTAESGTAGSAAAQQE